MKRWNRRMAVAWALALAGAAAGDPPGRTPLGKVESFGVTERDGIAYAPLPRAEPVSYRAEDGLWPALEGTARMLEPTVPVFPGIRAKAEATEGEAPGFAPLGPRAEAPSPGGYPTYAALRLASASVIDPLMPPVELWGGGPAGELLRAAHRARDAGDAEAYDELARRYRQVLGTALERRQVHGASR